MFEHPTQRFMYFSYADTTARRRGRLSR